MPALPVLQAANEAPEWAHQFARDVEKYVQLIWGYAPTYTVARLPAILGDTFQIIRVINSSRGDVPAYARPSDQTWRFLSDNAVVT